MILDTLNINDIREYLNNWIIEIFKEYEFYTESVQTKFLVVSRSYYALGVAFVWNRLPPPFLLRNDIEFVIALAQP